MFTELGRTDIGGRVRILTVLGMGGEPIKIYFSSHQNLIPYCCPGELACRSSSTRILDTGQITISSKLCWQYDTSSSRKAALPMLILQGRFPSMLRAPVGLNVALGCYWMHICGWHHKQDS